MEMNYCRRCGKPLSHDRGHIYQCINGHTIYANEAPGIGVFFVSDDNTKVLLSVRGIEPNKGMLDALGGFLDANESLEDAVTRELREELYLEPTEYEPLNYLTSGYDQYVYQREAIPFVGVLFWTRLRTTRPLSPSDDVAAVEWHPLADINMDRIDTEDIRRGIRALQMLFPEAAHE